jgi:CYTH domain-containing protein
MEIERKFLLNAFPIAVPYAKSIIYQSYLSTSPEVRIREKVLWPTEATDYTITVKGEGDLSRFEAETMITHKFYVDTLRFLGKKPIKKNYFKYYIDDHDIEISLVDDGAFIYAEVEFRSEEEAKAYEWPWPEILEREITYDKNYKMKNYWLDTRCGL